MSDLSKTPEDTMTWAARKIQEQTKELVEKDKLIAELQAERDEWKAKYEWAANKLKEIAEQEITTSISESRQK